MEPQEMGECTGFACVSRATCSSLAKVLVGVAAWALGTAVLLISWSWPFALARRAQREGRSYSKSGAESCSSASHPHARSIIKRRVQDGVGQQDQDAQGAVPQLEGVSRLRGCWMCPYLSSQNGMVNGRCGGDAITCKEGGAVGGMRRELLLVRAEQCCAMGRTREIDSLGRNPDGRLAARCRWCGATR